MNNNNKNNNNNNENHNEIKNKKINYSKKNIPLALKKMYG